MSESQMFQSKSLLAKLLAQENLLVVHRKVPTAYFDLATRTIILPVWKDMDDPTLYDLLMGHEVGHALHTPKQGWHDAVVQNKSLKTYLNVIEDARIERKMKDKYPGLRRSFNLAYKKLHEQDFFAIANQEIAKFLLIDRINIFYKLGAHVNVPFTSDELKYIDRINAAETWEDVEAIARDLFDKAVEDKKNQPDESNDDEEDEDGDSDSSDQFDSDDSDFNDEEYDYDEDYDYDQTDDGRKFENSSEQENSEEEEDESETNNGSMSNGADAHDEDEKVASRTDQAFRSNENRLIDDSSGQVYVLNVPQYNGKEIISYKDVHQPIREMIESLQNNPKHVAFGYYNGGEGNKKIMARVPTMYGDMLKRVNPVVNYMVKEFEMRKNATQLARAKAGKSGKINPKRLSRYSMENDIFQRITTVPQGKNHGLVMFIDLSGSMNSILEKTFEQAILLTMFCKKVNIPFEVYGFSNYPRAYTAIRSSSTTSLIRKPNQLSGYDQDFIMKQYLTSGMSSTVYRQAVANMLFVGAAHSSYSGGYMLPESEQLYGTPLDESIISSIGIVSQFKKNHRLDIVNSIFLTDGIGATHNNFINDKMLHSYFKETDTVYVQHPESKDRVKIKDMNKQNNYDYYRSTRALIEIAQTVTGAKYTGYYIGNGKDVASMLLPYMYPHINRDADKMNRTQLIKMLKEDGFISSEYFGFEEYFLVMNDNLKVEAAEIEADVGAKKGVLAKAFMKSLNKRGLQRMFLNKFVQNLAA